MTDEKLFFMRAAWHFDPAFKRPARIGDHLGFDTKALHAGFRPSDDMERFRAFVPPIVPSMTYPYKQFDQIPYPVYGRTKTPTADLLEQRLAILEGGQAALSAGSGSQALFNLIFTIARPGDNIVTSLNTFGEGYKQAVSIFPERCGIYFHFVKDPCDPESWDREIDKKTKLVWVETPSNPTLFVTDIQAVADVAHSHQVPLMVDNTTATAALQRPLELGADVVLLSITKFLAGNATVLGGAIIGPEDLTEDIRWNTTEFVGSIMQPFDSWLTLQYLETLPLRMQKHSSNSQTVAEFLSNHAKVKQVNYPGLKSHPQYELARRQMNAGGGMLSFVVGGGMDGARTLIDGFKLIIHAVTFGTSRTICMHPRTITHEHLTQEERDTAGIDDGLIRLSVGLEDPADLIHDLDQALARL
ncbi:MAG TPA: aminotransferase class I/II-fold pyridoxal phosphate-dependent enzyme [Anaerolineales bacterium]|nr:aminotransferase class I/II-fold pyridoxal phosphate-dependent enzyme [Anaerolineales bacterium]